MQHISTVLELKNTILVLEKKREEQSILLKKEFHQAFESLKPVNLLKSTFTELTTSPEFKGNVLNTTLGLAAGYLSKKVLIGATRNPFKKLLGMLVQMSVTKVVEKHPETIKTKGMALLKKVFSN